MFKITHIADSFAMLAEMKSDLVDVIITDPPYSKHCQSNMVSGFLVGTKAFWKYDSKFPPLIHYDWLRDCLRIAKRWVVVFCVLEDFGRFEMAVRKGDYVRSCIWYKPNSMGQLTRDRPANGCEGVALLHRSDTTKKWNGQGSYGIWKCNGTRGLKGRHPNEKPIALCRKLVALFTERGDTVFDPFCGSGAIGQACIELDRSYIGYDNEPMYIATSNARLGVTEVSIDVEEECKHAIASCSMRPRDHDERLSNLARIRSLARIRARKR